MELLKIVIIDDESSAREATKLMLKAFCPDLKIIGEFEGVDAAVEFLDFNSVDIVFLDIEMPRKNGFELFNSMDCSNFQVIMLTGHNQYAIQAFKNAACHYLLKPLVPEELIKAISIAKKRLQYGTSVQQLDYLRKIMKQTEDFPETIVVHVKQGCEILTVKSIIRFEGERNYTWVRSENQRFLTSKSLKEFEEILNPSQFYRIHQSHLINRDYLKKIINNGSSSSIQLANGNELPVSRHRKREFIAWLENR